MRPCVPPTILPCRHRVARTVRWSSVCATLQRCARRCAAGRALAFTAGAAAFTAGANLGLATVQAAWRGGQTPSAAVLVARRISVERGAGAGRHRRSYKSGGSRPAEPHPSRTRPAQSLLQVKELCGADPSEFVPETLSSAVAMVRAASRHSLWSWRWSAGVALTLRQLLATQDQDQVGEQLQSCLAFQRDYAI